MKTIDMLITELRDTAYDTGWYAGKIEEMAVRGVDRETIEQWDDTHLKAIKTRQAAEQALREAVLQ